MRATSRASRDRSRTCAAGPGCSTADSNASERPWNHSRSPSGQILDRVGDARERRRTLGREAVEDRGHRLLDDAQLDALVAAREIDVVDLLVAQAAERRLLARDRRSSCSGRGARARRAWRPAGRRRRRRAARAATARARAPGRPAARARTSAAVPVANSRPKRQYAEPAEQRGRDDRDGDGGQDPGPRVVQRVLEVAAVALRAVGGGLLARHRRGQRCSPSTCLAYGAPAASAAGG